MTNEQAPTLFDQFEDFVSYTPPKSKKKKDDISKNHNQEDLPSKEEDVNNNDIKSKNNTTQAYESNELIKENDEGENERVSNTEKDHVGSMTDANTQNHVTENDTALIYKEYPFTFEKIEVVESVQEKKSVKDISIPKITQESNSNFTSAPAEPMLAEWDLKKKYYSIGEVAQLFAVNTSHIRFWTNEFKIKPRTTKKGSRLYNIEDINYLRLIHHLVKEKQHTIKGAKEKIKELGEKKVSKGLDLKESLMNLKSMLLQIKESL